MAYSEWEAVQASITIGNIYVLTDPKDQKCPHLHLHNLCSPEPGSVFQEKHLKVQII